MHQITALMWCQDRTGRRIPPLSQVVWSSNCLVEGGSAPFWARGYIPNKGRFITGSQNPAQPIKIDLNKKLLPKQKTIEIIILSNLLMKILTINIKLFSVL